MILREPATTAQSSQHGVSDRVGGGGVFMRPKYQIRCRYYLVFSQQWSDWHIVRITRFLFIAKYTFLFAKYLAHPSIIREIKVRVV